MLILSPYKQKLEWNLFEVDCYIKRIIWIKPVQVTLITIIYLEKEPVFNTHFYWADTSLVPIIFSLVESSLWVDSPIG